MPIPGRSAGRMCASLAGVLLIAAAAGACTPWCIFPSDSCGRQGEYGFGALERIFTPSGPPSGPDVYLKCRDAAGKVAIVEAPTCPPGTELVGSTRSRTP